MQAFKVTSKEGSKEFVVMASNIARIERVEGKPGKPAQPAQHARRAEPGVTVKFDEHGKVVEPGKPPIEALEAKPAVPAVPAVAESSIIHLKEGGDIAVHNTVEQLLHLING